MIFLKVSMMWIHFRKNTTLKLTQEEIKNMKTPVTSNKIEFVINKTLCNTNSRLRWFYW